MGENASKALLMAAGMIIAVLLISLLVVLYDQISTHYAQDHKMTVMEQTQKFNAKFENYNRNNIRGSDLISLMNKVIDYNATESYFDGTDYERIRVTITLGNDNIIEQFKPPESTGSTTRNQYLTSTITNTAGTNWESDRNLVAITNTPSDLSDDLSSYGVLNISDTQLQQLTTGITKIMASENDKSAWEIYNRLKRADLLEEVLGITTISIDPSTGISGDRQTRNIITQVKNMVSQYYQYMQFKRAYFDCVSMKYDEQTNRVVEMQFRLQVKDGNVVFD